MKTQYLAEAFCPRGLLLAPRFRWPLNVYWALVVVSILGGTPGCHAGAAEATCGRLADRLYHARAVGDEATVRTLLSTDEATARGEADNAKAVLDHDKRFGPPGDRRRYLVLTGDHDTAAGGHYYSVRLGFEVRVATGQEREVVECRVASSGRQGRIDHIELDPSGPR